MVNDARRLTWDLYKAFLAQGSDRESFEQSAFFKETIHKICEPIVVIDGSSRHEVGNDLYWILDREYLPDCPCLAAKTYWSYKFEEMRQKPSEEHKKAL